jgi:hypothetical protein
VQSSGIENDRPSYVLDIGDLKFDTTGTYPNQWQLTNETFRLIDIPHLDSDTPCPFGTYTIEEGSIFESFIVEPCY